MNTLIDTWKSLDNRQRKWTLFGVGVVVCLLYYLLIYEPLHRSVLRLRQDIHNEQSLLIWMKQAKIQLSRKGRVVALDPANTNQSILALAEKSLQNAKLSSAIKELKQVDGGQVRVLFTNVVYTELLKWLDSFNVQFGAKIERVKMRRIDNNGLVDAELTLVSA